MNVYLNSTGKKQQYIEKDNENNMIILKENTILPDIRQSPNLRKPFLEQ